MAGNTLMVAGAAALALACAGSVPLLLRGDRATREVQGRLRALAGDAAAPAKAAALLRHRDIRRTDSRSPLTRFLGRLGRSSHIPKEWRLAWPVLAAAAMAAAGGAAFGAGVVLSPMASPVAGLGVAGLILQFLFRWERQRYRQQIFVQIPEAMGLILRAIRAGLPMAEALTNVSREIATPSREEFARVAGEISIGRPVEAGLFGLAERTGLTEYFFFAVTVGLQAQTGGSLGETLENLADMVRKRVGLAAKMKAMTAEARMSAMILTGMPFVVAGFIVLVSPSHLKPLIETDQGFQMLMIGGGLMVTGLFIIRGMLRNAVKD